MTDFWEDFSADDQSRYYLNVSSPWVISGGVLSSPAGSGSLFLGAGSPDPDTGAFASPASYCPALSEGIETLKVEALSATDGENATLELWVTEAAPWAGWPSYEPVLSLGLDYSASSGGWQFGGGGAGVFPTRALAVLPPFPFWLALRVNADASVAVELWSTDPWGVGGSPADQITAADPFSGPAPLMIPALGLRDASGIAGGVVVDDWRWGTPGALPAPPSAKGLLQVGQHKVGARLHTRRA